MPETKGWRFDDHAGQQFVLGKTIWPDSIRISMDKVVAWRCVREMLDALENGESSVQLSLFGRLTRDERDDISHSG